MFSIYYIECPECQSTYVGKTTDLYNREKKHRQNTFNTDGDPYKRKVYTHFRDCNLERKQIVCQVLVENLEDEEAVLIEREYIRNIGDLNMLSGVMSDPNYPTHNKLEPGRRYEKKNRVERLRKQREKYRVRHPKIKSSTII
tara:strand:- start:113 stop:538 length:426 start_codon:yes stop_codon:yes gene_type:complete